MLTEVGGHLTARAEPYVWDNTTEPYVLTDHLTVDAGATLEIERGVEVYTSKYSYSDRNYDFDVEGTVNATGVEFTGSPDVNVRNGGRLNLTEGTTVSGSNADHQSSDIRFEGGGLGTVADSTFNIPVHHYSGTKADPLVSFTGNTFQDSNPVYTYGALVEAFTAPGHHNTFNASGGTSTISIEGGTLSEDASWQVSGTATRYSLTNHFTIDSRTTLEIGPDVDVYTNRYSHNDRIYDLDVDGTLNATDMEFVGYADLNIQNGATLNLMGSTVSGGSADREASRVDYRGNSAGTVRYSTFKIPVTFTGGADLSIRESDFSSTSVTASGGSTTTIDLTRNWWGTTDPEEIEGKIQHQRDDENLPLVEYDPWLLTSPDERLVYVTEYWPESPISWRTNFVDLTFSHEVDLSTFSADDVQLTSGGRAREIIDIAYVGDATYRLALAELLPAGPFNLEVGPDIADHNGHLMDQDWDGTRGEPFDDALFVQLEVDLTAPHIQRHQPAGDIAGTVEAVDVFFSERMNAASFTTSDVEITAPDGSPVAASSVEMRTQGIYRVHFPDQTDPGMYTITVGPHITDPAAHPLDQDKNGTAGEPTDVYHGTFNLVDVDLEISNVAIDKSELRAGETVNVSWDGANNAGYQLLGDWTDAVYLSADDAWDYDDVLLATVPHTGGLLQDEVYHESCDVVVPGELPGDYHIIVRADLYNQEKEAGLEGNNVTAIGPFTLKYNVLTAGGTADSGTLLPQDRFEYYTINLDPGENLRLTLDGQAASGSNRLYYGQGEVPTRQNYHSRTSNGTPDAELTVPGTYDGGDCYILIHASQIGAEQEYELTGQDYEVILDEVSPNHHGNAADATVTLSGDGFNETTTVTFITGNGTEKSPVETTVVSPTQMTAKLDLHDEAGNVAKWAADMYDVRATNTGGGTHLLGEAFRVYEGVGPILDVNLSVPRWVGRHGGSRLWIEYENAGDASMPAPGFIVHGTRNALLTLDSQYAGQRWEGTSNPPPGMDSTVMAWPSGSGATPGMVQPGESGRIPVFYAGLGAGAPGGRNIEFSLGALTADEDTDIAWDTMKSDARPEWLDTETWDAMWQNFTEQTGDTWGDFVQTRAEIVNYIHSLGQDAADLTMDQVLGFAVALAGDVGPNPYLAGSVDAANPAPGIPLVFSRIYDASFESRYEAEPFGRGWTHNWAL